MSDTTSSVSTRTSHPCACLTGTGQQCDRTTGKVFAQGHDARMSSRLATAIAEGKLTREEATALIRTAGGGDLLVSKTLHSATLRTNNGGPKAPRAKKSDEVAEKAPTIQVVGTKVKIHHGKRSFEGTVVRNAAEKLVARHRMIGKNCDHDVEVAEDGEVFTGTKIS